MLDTGIPSTFIRCIWSFFNDCRTRFKVFNAFSSSRRFTQGLPQGSFLVPLLVLFSINNLASLLNNDVSIPTTVRKKEDAVVVSKSALNSMFIWIQKWKLNLDADKSEVFPFSTWPNESYWQPALFIGPKKIQVNATPRLLGVILDGSLTFNVHLKKRTTFLSSSLHIIRATAHTFWGWCYSTLKIAFHALIHSKLDYAAPVYQSWLCTTNLSCLDCLQNCSLWFITGQLVSTSLEALCLEADAQSYQTCRNCLILKAQEKALRSTDDHPKRVALAADIRQHLQNSFSFRCKTNDLSTLLPGEL